MINKTEEFEKWYEKVKFRSHITIDITWNAAAELYEKEIEKLKCCQNFKHSTEYNYESISCNHPETSSYPPVKYCRRVVDLSEIFIKDAEDFWEQKEVIKS